MKRVASLVLSLLVVAALGQNVAAGNLNLPGGSVPLYAKTKALLPSAPGTQSYDGGGATLDLSNTSEGYIACRYSGGTRAKVRISYPGGALYTYDLRSDGVYEFYPLSGGNGTYQVNIFRNISGDQYAQILSKTTQVQFRDSLLPFLYPNQFINFNQNSASVKLGETLAANTTTDLETVAAVYNYVIQNISYDNNRAYLVTQGKLMGYVPNLDQVLADKKGICFDYAALMASMLRSQQIPTRMEFGYVSNGAYHAWISVYIPEIGWVNGLIQFDGVNWKLMDPTFAASGNSSPEIMKYIGNGANYRTQYMY